MTCHVTLHLTRWQTNPVNNDEILALVSEMMKHLHSATLAPLLTGTGIWQRGRRGLW